MTLSYVKRKIYTGEKLKPRGNNAPDSRPSGGRIMGGCFVLPVFLYLPNVPEGRRSAFNIRNSNMHKGRALDSLTLQSCVVLTPVSHGLKGSRDEQRQWRALLG